MVRKTGARVKVHAHHPAHVLNRFSPVEKMVESENNLRKVISAQVEGRKEKAGCSLNEGARMTTRADEGGVATFHLLCRQGNCGWYVCVLQVGWLEKGRERGDMSAFMPGTNTNVMPDGRE